MRSNNKISLLLAIIAIFIKSTSTYSQKQIHFKLDTILDLGIHWPLVSSWSNCVFDNDKLYSLISTNTFNSIRDQRSTQNFYLKVFDLTNRNFLPDQEIILPDTTLGPEFKDFWLIISERSAIIYKGFLIIEGWYGSNLVFEKKNSKWVYRKDLKNVAFGDFYSFGNKLLNIYLDHKLPALRFKILSQKHLRTKMVFESNYFDNSHLVKFASSRFFIDVQSNQIACSKVGEYKVYFLDKKGKVVDSIYRNAPNWRKMNYDSCFEAENIPINYPKTVIDYLHKTLRNSMSRIVKIAYINPNQLMVGYTHVDSTRICFIDVWEKNNNNWEIIVDGQPLDLRKMETTNENFKSGNGYFLNLKAGNNYFRNGKLFSQSNLQLYPEGTSTDTKIDNLMNGKNTLKIYIYDYKIY